MTMKKEHMDAELYEILHFTPEVSSEVQNKIDAAYEKVKKEKTPAHEKKKFRGSFYMGIAAAILLTLVFLGFSNPVLAGKIPFIGRIFQMLEGQIGYPGDYSENAVTFPGAEAAEDENPASENESAEPDADDLSEKKTLSNESETGVYSQTSGDVTITLSEACCNEMALYFSLELYSEEGFPDSFSKLKTMPGYILSYDFLMMQSSQTFDFSQADSASPHLDMLTASEEAGLTTAYYIEGIYVDSHTFLGIVRVDLDEVKRIAEIDALPPEFTYSFTIRKFWGETDEMKEVSASNAETGETLMIKTPVKKYYEGPWSFTFPVSLDTANTQIREIMETNAEGVGISTVTKTPYELKAELLLPEGVEPWDYIVAVTDADGKILDSQGQRTEIYSVYGRNTDTVHIYVMDYYTYMDECKGENAYLLPEKALFQTSVTW